MNRKCSVDEDTSLPGLSLVASWRREAVTPREVVVVGYRVGEVGNRPENKLANSRRTSDVLCSPFWGAQVTSISNHFDRPPAPCQQSF